MLRQISLLKGVGPKTAAILSDMGIVSFYDLLTYYPKGYEHFKGLTGKSEWQNQDINYIKVKVTSTPKMQYYGKMAVFSFYVVDREKNRIKITYFRQPYLAKTMQSGRIMIVKGRIFFKKGEYQMVNPEIVSEEDLKELEKTPIIPKYTVRKGISENKIKLLIKQAFSKIDEQQKQDYIEENVRQKYGLLEFWQALRQIHFPKTEQELVQAKQRLVFDEFYFFQAGIHLKEAYPNAFKVKKQQLMKQFIDSLPYQLTEDQDKTIGDIVKDMKGVNRMARLVQGDVGSGKTAVALAVGVNVIENGYQVAMMAPTEVLARQHYLEAEEKLTPFGIRVCLLLGSTLAKQKKQIYQEMAEGKVDLIIGTHALIQEKAVYHKLGLVITDEQHRFGVMQRERLSQKGGEEELPHILVMSATPIPRTLALILYQDMDISVIQSMPSERLPIQSFLRNANARQKIYDFMKREIKDGAAAYIICPAIEDNEELALSGVINYTEQLKEMLPDVRIASIYGSQEDKDEVMQSFAAGNTDILVSTTVIEVGVNVPRATVMLIENAERFGLAQLHQLRGRVGRGNRQSYCILLSESKEEAIREKLQFVVNHSSGFEIAEYDLKMRGPGDVFGIKQHGMPILQLADLYHDLPILEIVQKAGKEIASSPFRNQLMQIYYQQNKKILSL